MNTNEVLNKLIAEIEIYENTAIDAYNPLGEEADYWHGKVVACEDLKNLVTSLQQEQPDNMIQWTGNNLKEVIDFTGKSPRFGEWFYSWEEYENYVHTHNNILKLFCEDGSPYEVPVGAWIVKTPDGHNVPSVANYVQQEQPESSFLIKKAIVWFNNIAESAKKLSAGNVSHVAPTIIGKAIRCAEYLEKRKQVQPEVDLEKDVKSYIKDNFTITDEVAQIPEEDRRYSMWEDDMVAFARHFWNKGYNARKEEQV